MLNLAPGWNSSIVATHHTRINMYRIDAINQQQQQKAHPLFEQTLIEIGIYYYI